MKRRLLSAAAACTVLSLVALTVPSVAFADTTPAEQAFQASLTIYVQNLQSAVLAASQNPSIAATVTPQLQNDLASLSVASQEIPSLTSDQLDAMQGILGQNASWQQQPLVMQQDFNGMTVKAPTTANPAGFLSDCSSPGDPRSLFYAYWAAAQVAAAANAVASGLPDGADFAPALIIAAVIFGVANGVAIGLQSSLALAQDCQTAVANAALEATWPTYPETSSTFAQISSQISVDQLAQLSQGIQQTLDQIQNTINVTTTNLTTTINTLGIAQGTANDIVNVATDLQSRTDSLLNKVGGPTDQATDPCATYSTGCGPPTGTSNGLANTINTRENTTLSNTQTFQNLSVRAEIETALAEPSNGTLALFQLPASQGGYLQTVQSIVTQTIQNMLAAGQSIGTAQAKLAAGNAALAAGQYDTAYQDFQLAYDQAS